MLQSRDTMMTESFLSFRSPHFGKYSGYLLLNNKPLQFVTQNNNLFILLLDSVTQRLRQGSVALAYLCSINMEPPLGRLQWLGEPGMAFSHV